MRIRPPIESISASEKEELTVAREEAAADETAAEVKETSPLAEWRQVSPTVSQEETHSSVRVAALTDPWYRKLWSFSGLGLLIAVGYMDPGNWATDVAGGAGFEYSLLCVILLASLAAMQLQYLALKLGVATDRDLAMAVRDSFHPKVVVFLWIVVEVAIAATDLAELLGGAIALFLLTGLAIPAGVVVLSVDVLFILLINKRRVQVLEFIVLFLTSTIVVCLVYIIALAQPDWGRVMNGYLIKPQVLTDPRELFLSIGILGATVMPHNLFLHSSHVQSRAYPRTLEGRKMAVRYASIDSIMSLSVAFLVNSFILILAGSAFHANYSDTADLTSANELLAPALG
jgi:manganese transport protein